MARGGSGERKTKSVLKKKIMSLGRSDTSCGDTSWVMQERRFGAEYDGSRRVE